MHCMDEHVSCGCVILALRKEVEDFYVNSPVQKARIEGSGLIS